MPLRGSVCISGAKNAALVLIAASIMAKGETVLENIPNIEDVNTLVEILQEMDVAIVWNDEHNSLTIQAPEGAITRQAPLELTSKLRASNLLLGPLLGRQAEGIISASGGCDIGLRPIDLHIKGFEAMGAKVELLGNCIQVSRRNANGARIYLDFPSVGATENIMMMAALTPGQTVIENAAKEPEIVNLASFLIAMGASIRGAGTGIINITGVDELRAVHYSAIPDRIEAGTYMLAAAATRGDVIVENIILQHLSPVIAKLREMGAQVEVLQSDKLRVNAENPLRPVNIKTMPYPGFPTDMQSQMIALLANTPGTSTVEETIFENRFRIISELCRMGANVQADTHLATLQGIPRLYGATVTATDLRAGAALIIAGCAAEGVTVIEDAVHIFRGYESVVEKFRKLGAHIEDMP